MQGKDKDLLFLLTEQHHFSVVEYDAEKGESTPRAHGQHPEGTEGLSNLSEAEEEHIQIKGWSSVTKLLSYTLSSRCDQGLLENLKSLEISVCEEELLGFGFVGELVTHAMGNASAKVGRVNSNGIMGIVDPECRMIALHIYDAIIKVSTLIEACSTIQTPQL